MESNKHTIAHGMGAWLILLLLGLASFLGCTDGDIDARRAAAADSLINALSEQRAFESLLKVADSLGNAGAMRKGDSYFWQGFAAYRMIQRNTAEFYWNEAMKATASSTDKADIACYARSASYLASSMCRSSDFGSVLKIAPAAANRLEQLGCDTTSDYSNIIIFIGCSLMHFGEDSSAINSRFNRAYAMHLDNIKRKGTSDAYHDAVAGLINIAYSSIMEKHYEQALTWSDRFGQLIEDYRVHFTDDKAYIDKQWGRHLVFRATALEGMGRSEEAAAAYDEYQLTAFAHSMEGLTDATEYLMLANRWDEAVVCYRALNDLLLQESSINSLENIQKFRLKKYHANVMDGQIDTANAVANTICQLLDSAIIRSRLIDAEEQKAIREKEMQMAQQKLEMSRLRLINSFIVLGVVIIVFVIFSIIRQRYAMRLEEKNVELAEKNDLLAVKNEEMAEKNEQLRVANARAEESSHMKSVFIQQISHEIRTPLNILSGFTQVLTTPDMELDNDTRNDINKEITKNTERITRLVNKMLELSDSESQAVIERTDTIPAIQIAAEAIDASRISNAPHLTFDIQFAPEAEEAVLQTQRQGAVRALSLVLDNARKFTAPAEAAQREGTTQEKKTALLRVEIEGECARFIVEDTGIGVPASEAEHIFEEFVQLDDYYDGTGIGLTVARSLARRLGGDITLDTSYSAGARFVVTLPYEKA